MSNSKLRFRNHKILGLIRCLFVLCFTLSFFVQANGVEPNLAVSLSCFREQVVLTDPNQKRPLLIPAQKVSFFEPLILKLTIANNSQNQMSVLWPEFPARTLIPVFRNKSDGKLIAPQLRWSASLSQDFINIPPANTYEVLLYLEEIFPCGIPPATYEIRLKYTPDYKTWVETNAVRLQIAPMSQEEKKDFEEVGAILRAGSSYKPKAIRLFLAKSPDSRYRNLLRLRSSVCLMTLKQFDSAASILDTIIGDQKSTTCEKSRAYWRKGHLLKNAGKLEEAIKCIEKSQLRTAHRDAMQWKTEKEFSKKKEE